MLASAAPNGSSVTSSNDETTDRSPIPTSLPLEGAEARICELQEQVEALTAQLEAYACQVTSDFEELSWLRGLAAQLGVGDSSNEAATVAESVLPTLRELIRAEAVAFLPEYESLAAAELAPLSSDDALLIVGETQVSASLCRALIEQFAPAALAQPILRNAVSRDDHLPGFPGLHNCILVRVARGNRLFGWVLAVNKLSGDAPRAIGADGTPLPDWEFGTFEAGLVSAVVVMLAAHAHNVELMREKEAMLIGVIRAFINALDAKDTYTCGHSDRVALIAKRLAEELQLGREECERVYMAGLLHDIGKIGVADDVLSKPGKLSDEEFQQIKRHPEIGHSILKHVSQLGYVLPGVLHHHETVDGRGYPHALAGEQIPLQGRILAVADAYDAMTSTRPYRMAMPTERAESILREGAGTQWDICVLGAFFSALSDIRAVRGTDAEHTQALYRVPVCRRGETVPIDAISTAVGALTPA